MTRILVSINLFRTSKLNVIKFAKEYSLAPESLLGNKDKGYATMLFIIDENGDGSEVTDVAISKSVSEKKMVFKSEELEKEYKDKLEDFKKYDPKLGRLDFVESIKEVKVEVVEDLDDMDSILDKISKSGLASLTDGELRFLKSL